MVSHCRDLEGINLRFCFIFISSQQHQYLVNQANNNKKLLMRMTETRKLKKGK